MHTHNPRSAYWEKHDRDRSSPDSNGDDSSATNASAGATNAHLLSCAYGSIASHGEIPFGVPIATRERDSEFAEAVVEINRQSELTMQPSPTSC